VLALNFDCGLDRSLNLQMENGSIYAATKFVELFDDGCDKGESGTFTLELHAPASLLLGDRKREPHGTIVCSALLLPWSSLGCVNALDVTGQSKILLAPPCSNGLAFYDYVMNKELSGLLITTANTTRHGSNLLLWLELCPTSLRLNAGAMDPIPTFACRAKFKTLSQGNRCGLRAWPVLTHLPWLDLGLQWWPPQRPGMASVGQEIRSCPLTGQLTLVSVATSPPPRRGCPSVLYTSASPLPLKGRAGGPHSEAARKKKVLKTALKKLGDHAPGFLKSGSVRSEKGRQNYLEGTAKFRAWALSRNLQTADHDELDASLTTHVEELALEEGSMFWARCAVYGEAWRRSFNLRNSDILFSARSSLTGWKKLVPEGGRDPCPWIMAADVCTDL
jgi:hypothetical protein